MQANMPLETEAGVLPDWPAGLTRIPYWAFQSEALHAREQARLFGGPYWSYLCLAEELNGSRRGRPKRPRRPAPPGRWRPSSG
jgi:hypothetical protein